MLDIQGSWIFLIFKEAQRYEAGDEAGDDAKCRRRSGDEADTTLQYHEEWTRVNCNDIETSNFDCLTLRRIYWNIEVLDRDPWATEPNHIDWGHSNSKTQLPAVPLSISSRTARSKTVQEYLDTCDELSIYLFHPRQEHWKYDQRFTRSRHKVANAGPAQQLIRIDCWRRRRRPAISTNGLIGLPLFKFNAQAAFWKHSSFRDFGERGCVGTGVRSIDGWWSWSVILLTFNLFLKIWTSSSFHP